MQKMNLEGKKVGGFTLVTLVGAGSFGKVYIGKSDSVGRVAVKIDSKLSGEERLRREFNIYTLLKGSIGFPKVFACGRENIRAYLAMEELGLSLEDIFEARNRKFTMKTVLMIADQVLDRLQDVHGNKYLHRDVKPANFMIGKAVEPFEVIYMVDFGLSEKFIDEENVHVPNEPRFGIGTPMYASKNVHAKNRPSRRDDLESLAYMLAFFLRGNLPWEGVKCMFASLTWEKIGEIKENTSAKDLYSGFPTEFSEFLEYTWQLGYEETPDYDFAKNLFKRLAASMDIQYDKHFDWLAAASLNDISLPGYILGRQSWNKSSMSQSYYELISFGSN